MLIEMEKIPLGRATTPTDVANAIAFLGSRDSSHMVARFLKRSDSRCEAFDPMKA